MWCKIRQMKVNKLVMVTWVDSHRQDGWTSDAVEAKPVVCRSVGWLTGSTKEAKTITPHMSQEDNPQRCGCMTIPVRSILKLKQIS